MPCWICESTDEVMWKAGNGPGSLRAEDLKITDDHYGVTLPLWRCRACGFIHAERSALPDLDGLYADLVDEGYDASESARARQMRWLVQLARRVRPRARTGLDVGAATGLLVREARAAGLDMMGIEPSAALVELALRRHDVQLVRGVLPHPQLAQHVFDVVFLVDVIEHVADPVALLSRCVDVLAPGGVVIVVTPDIGSRTARVMGKRWWHLRLAHVGYFDTESFTRAARGAGLAVVERTRARWFFPVDYLAHRLERYLPVGWINRLSAGMPPLRWLYQRSIPLNLHDSNAFVLERGAA